MILDGIDVFAKVVEAGGLSAAARQLGMPVTTVSAKLARLEERLGVTLIQRSTRKMYVTPAGTAYYAYCSEALRSLEAGEAGLAEANAEPSGTFRITAPSDLAQMILPPIIQQFVTTYPRISLDLIATNTQLDLLAEGVDLAMRASPMRDSTLQSRKFSAATLAMFASTEYLKARGRPQSPADLADHIVLVHSRFPPNLFLMASPTDRFQVSATGRIRADDMQTLRALAMVGAGIAVLPDFPGGTIGLERVLPDYTTQSGAVYFVYPAGKFTPVNVRAFIDLALAMPRPDTEARASTARGR
ncbi:MAG: LysR family transcriptional regulator [Devosia sp.]